MSDTPNSLAICLEVAEHLSEPAVERLIELLASTSDVILFSAAVPGQGGDNHLCERWPDYFQGLLAARGFSCDDEIRWAFWANDGVDWWYRQNMFVACRPGGEPAALVPKKPRQIEDFYEGRVPLRTGALVFFRSFKNLLHRWRRRI